MKTFRNIAVGLAVAAAVFGCKRQTTDVVEQGTTPLLVEDVRIASADDPNLVASKVTPTGFEVNDSISFYAVRFTNGAPNELGADATSYLNHKLYRKRTADLLFASWNGSAFVDEYFPNDGSSIDIYGFYPYRTKPTSYTNYNFPIYVDQSNASKWSYNASDLMAAKTPAIKPTAVPNKLVFNHLLSRVAININLVNFAGGSTIQAATLLGVNTHAQVNLRFYDDAKGIAGKVLSSSMPANVLPYKESVPATGYGFTYSAVVAPQDFAASKELVKLTVWDGSKATDYSLTLTSALTLESGKAYTFNLSIDRGSRPNIGVAPTITPWTTKAETGSAVKDSENKFVTTLTNVGSVSINQVTQVKVGVNGNRTFTLPATYSATGGSGGAAAVLWEFRGTGNRPMEYPFDIRTIEFLSASSASLGGVCTANPAIVLQSSDASETIAVGVTVDLTAKTVTRP